MAPNIHLPFYLKIAQIFLGIIAFFFILYIGQDIIIPITYAMLIAVLLNPFVNYLCKHKFNRAVAILLAILLAFILVVATIYFIASQVIKFGDTLPQLKVKFNLVYQQGIGWVSEHLNISKSRIDNWINNTKGEGMKNSNTLIGQTITTIGGVLVIIFLLPVYIFMILFYKPLLVEFISRLFPKDKHSTVAEVLMETKALISNYLVGLLFEMVIVAILNIAALLILGIQYAVLLGIIGALLNLIPYIGGIVAIALPMIIAIATKSPEYALYVLIAYIIVQFIDNNFLVPKIVASKVKINALVSIIVVLVGGAMWGIPGMFLSIPLIAILKVMFDRINPLKPWGFLLGDTIPSIVSFKFNLPKKRVKKQVIQQ
ncbi:MAG: AI-2E family transporter [Ferruginibacter sp.]